MNPCAVIIQSKQLIMARNFIKNNKVIPIVLGLGASANVLYFGANMLAAYYGKDEDPSALKNNQAILKDMKLVSVQVFFRHGARLPLKHMPGIEEVITLKDECCLDLSCHGLSYCQCEKRLWL